MQDWAGRKVLQAEELFFVSQSAGTWKKWKNKTIFFRFLLAFRVKVLLSELKQRKIIAKFRGIGVHQDGLFFLPLIMDTNYSHSSSFIIPICSQLSDKFLMRKLNKLPQENNWN